MTDTASDPGGRKIPGTIRQKQKGFVALRLHVVGGEFDADQIRAIAGVAEKYGRDGCTFRPDRGPRSTTCAPPRPGPRSASSRPRA